MDRPIHLLLKFAAAAAAGTAALLSFRRHSRFSSMLSLRHSIVRALFHLPAGAGGGAAPPVILVIGFRGHGKSAFVNTACRALADETGLMVLRTETAPANLPPTTAWPSAVRVAVADVCGSCGSTEETLERDGLAVKIIDSPPLPEPKAMTPVLIEAALDAAVGVCGEAAVEAPECVVVVFRCYRQARGRLFAVRRLTEIAGVVRNRGLALLVVLTHKKSLKNGKLAEELKREISLRARTDCVYFIENYIARCSTKCQTPLSTKNDFDTHYTALTIIRQCIEFVEQHRRRHSTR